MTETTINLDDYRDDPVTLAGLDLLLMAAGWEPDVRDEVLATLGGLAIICGTRGAPVHVACAEWLSASRHLIRIAGAGGDAHELPTSVGSTHISTQPQAQEETN